MKAKLLITAMLLTTLGAFAQSNQPAMLPPEPIQNFAVTVEQYFSSFNTNLPPFSAATVEIATGYKQVTGANAASEIYAQYNIHTNFDVMVNFQFSGIGSAINAAEIGAGYALINRYDAKLQLDLLVGYDGTKLDNKGKYGSVVIEPRLSVKKKLSQNTFAEMAISEPVFTVGRLNSTPSLFIGAGVTF